MNISYKQLGEIRVNSAVIYKVNPDENSATNNCKCLDEMQENNNGDSKILPVGSDEESWIEHTPNLMFGKQSIAFVDAEYHHRELFYDNEEYGNDNNVWGSKLSYGQTPRSIHERETLDRFITKFFLLRRITENILINKQLN